MDSIYKYEDYKKYLGDRIRANESTRGYKALLADAAQCQRSFMSQVLNSHVHLTPDHAAGLATFWKLDASSTEYFLEMVHLARAATPGLRHYLQRRLQQLAARAEEAATRMEKQASVEKEHQSIYYSSWYWSALHMMVSTQGTHTEKSLSERINLPLKVVKEALAVLEKMGLIRKEKGGWVPTRNHLYESGDSVYSWLHHASWRNKANDNMREKKGEPIHFTAVYSLSRKDFKKIDDLIIQLMTETNKIVEPSAEEEVACLCVDWFQV